MEPTMVFDVRKIEPDDDPGNPFPFVCDDEQFVFPPPRLASWTFLHSYAHRQLFEAVQALLSDEPPRDAKGNATGPSDFARFKNLNLDYHTVSELLIAYIESAKVSAGESEASTSSSKSTETPSKRTSAATTD
jgi:hypothetical protein